MVVEIAITEQLAGYRYTNRFNPLKKSINMQFRKIYGFPLHSLYRRYDTLAVS